MKLFVALLLFASFCISFVVGAPDFTNVWMDGPQASGVAGNSTYPNARQKAASWTDSAGNFWLYGGTDNASTTFYNDLWTYNVTAQEWKNIDLGNNVNYPSVGGTGYPDRRASAVTWQDASGNLYMFGGTSGVGIYYDFWSFNSNTRVWTLLAGGAALDQTGNYVSVGSTGYPSARMGGVGWTDFEGKLWLFGGDLNGAKLNDLWYVRLSAPETWTWVGGAQTGGTQQGGGTNQVGYPAPTAFAGAWTDSTKRFLFLYGGIDSVTFFWRYSIDASNWVSLGNTSASTNNNGPIPPSTRHGFSVFVDSASSIYIFGGRSGSDAYDAVWNYNIDSNTWTLSAGRITANYAGVFEIIAPPLAQISARGYYASWKDTKGQFWVFGGSLGSNAPLSDLWRITSVDVCATAQCDPAATCGNNRYLCTCNSGYIGNGFKCCNNITTCNGNGVCNATTFACDCEAKYNVTASPRCDVCAGNLFGPDCDIPCSPAANCSNHGQCVSENSVLKCSCAFNYKGATCDVCADNYFGTNCSVFCNATTTCSGLGTCNQTTGQCICANNRNGTDCTGCVPNYYGTNCTRFCNASTTCFGRGSCDASTGGCNCDPRGNFAGVRCETCATNFFGPNCTQYCDAQGQCNGKGNCNATGSCICTGNYAGATCSECAPNYFGDKCDFYCGNDTCNNHGSCVFPGVCICSGNFRGMFCSNCTDQFFGANCTTYCDSLSNCNNHGECNSTGGCTCNTGWDGDRCDECAPCYSGDSCQTFCPTGQSCSALGVCQVSAGSYLHISNWVVIVAVFSSLLLVLTQ